jgi:hypothetical protein
VSKAAWAGLAGVPPGARAARGAELERQEVKEVVVKAAVSTERQEAKEVVLDSLSESKKQTNKTQKHTHDETQIIPINDMRTHRGNPMCGLVHDHRAAAGLVAHAHIWSRAHVYTQDI